MISARFRIPKQYFPIVLKGPSLMGVFFKVTISPSISRKTAHFGIIIAKKHVKQAVWRNQLRRLIYTEIRNVLPQLPKKSFVFSAISGMTLSGVKKTNKNDIIVDIKGLLQNIITKYEKNP